MRHRLILRAAPFNGREPGTFNIPAYGARRISAQLRSKGEKASDQAET